MPSPKYHREQAQVLAGLALSTRDALQADRFTQAALEHLAQAQEDEVIHPPVATALSPARVGSS